MGSRTVNTDVVEKYRTKLVKLEEDITRVLEEEKAEREIAKLENRAGKLQNRIDGAEEERTWFQTKQQRKDEKQKLKQQQKDPTCAKRKRKLKKIRAVYDEDETVGTRKQKKSKSSFESHIVNTSNKAVKEFRHVANKKKNDDRRLLKKTKNGKNNKSSFK